MSWQDRVRQAAYNSPSGIRVEFTYENVGLEFDNRGTAFNYPNSDGSYIQDLGHTGRRYPFNIIFWGDNYDQEADFFLSLLEEGGVGKLEHPLYGVINVVPLGTIARRDNLKTAANQCIISLTFWETLEDANPNTEQSAQSEVFVNLGTYNEAAAQFFVDLSSLDTVSEQVGVLGQIKALYNNVKQGLRSVADTIESVQKTFNAIFDAINSSIDLLIKTPLTLANQLIALAETPARAATDIRARLDAYGNLLDQTIQRADGLPRVYGFSDDKDNSNKFHADELHATTFVASLIASVVNNTFETAQDAVGAADFILTKFDEVTEWRDLNYDSLQEIDTGESYQQLQNLVSIAVGFLVQISFNLKQARSITLTSPRSIIDLVGELYGTVDSELDFFIQSNNLSGSDILELPRGKTVVYYV